jgi:hypothetical protein
MLKTLLWVATAMYALHAMEEFIFDWRDWARNVLSLPVEWTTFYVTNAAVIVAGVVAANIVDALPAVALAFPALMLINAVCFHVAPFLWTRGRFSPGLFTALLLFLPMGVWCYRTARQGGVLTTETLVVSLLLGATMMAFPIVCLRLSLRSYFLQR